MVPWSSPQRTLRLWKVCFSEPDNYEPRPTLQAVEVVSDHREGRSVVGALKGDFYVGKLASTGTLGVVEDWTRKEYNDERASDGSDLTPGRWSVTYLDSTLRVARTEGGELMVFGKMAPGPAQAEIGALRDAPVAVIAEDEMEEEEDDRPLWQRRLDEERAAEGFDRFGPPGGSSIP